MTECRVWTASLRYGRPFANLGAGLTVSPLLSVDSVRLGASADYWYQEPWGHGGRALLRAEVPVTGLLGLAVGAGWKTAGYIPGERIGPGVVIRAGGYVRF